MLASLVKRPERLSAGSDHEKQLEQLTAKSLIPSHAKGVGFYPGDYVVVCYVKTWNPLGGFL